MNRDLAVPAAVLAANTELLRDWASSLAAPSTKSIVAIVRTVRQPGAWR
jgi:hypothetical protein